MRFSLIGKVFGLTEPERSKSFKRLCRNDSMTVGSCVIRDQGREFLDCLWTNITMTLAITVHRDILKQEAGIGMQQAGDGNRRQQKIVKVVGGNEVSVMNLIVRLLVKLFKNVTWSSLNVTNTCCTSHMWLIQIELTEFGRLHLTILKLISHILHVYNTSS